MGNNNYKNTEPNVPQETRDAWAAVTRRGDAQKIAKETGASIPVIYTALNKGYVFKPSLAVSITGFFLKRELEKDTRSSGTEALVKLIDNAQKQ